jgi:hypothetical protein
LERSHSAIVTWRESIWIIGGERIWAYTTPTASLAIEVYTPKDDLWGTSLIKLPPAFTQTHVHAILCDTTLLVYNTNGTQVWSLELTKALSSLTSAQAPSMVEFDWYHWNSMMKDRAGSCSLVL